jgi:hypothetical protein
MAFTFTLSPYDSLDQGEKLNNTLEGSGKPYSLLAKVSFDGTQSDGDVIPLAVVHGSDVFVEGGYGNDALAGLTDLDIGLYDFDGNAVDADFFVDGDSLATAQATRFGDNAMSATNVSDIVDSTSKLGDLASSLETTESYVLAATVNTSGSASGDFVIKYDIIRQN